MLKAIDAGQQRRLKKLRVKVIRASIIILGIVSLTLGYQRYQEALLWRAFNEVTGAFLLSHNEGKPGEFYDSFADDGLKGNQSREQYVRLQSRIQTLLGPLDEMKLAEFRTPTPDKPFYILIYRFRHGGKSEGRLSLALKSNLTSYRLYAWKIQAQALK